jgi:hypothetical protein
MVESKVISLPRRWATWMVSTTLPAGWFAIGGGGGPCSGHTSALRGAHQFKPGTNLRAWLFQILRNVFYTQYKRRKREPVATDPETLDAIGADACGDRVRDGASGSSDGTLRADLAAALERLPEEYRSVVLLADIEDFTMGRSPTAELPSGLREIQTVPAARCCGLLWTTSETPAAAGDAPDGSNGRTTGSRIHDVS